MLRALCIQMSATAPAAIKPKRLSASEDGRLWSERASDARVLATKAREGAAMQALILEMVATAARAEAALLATTASSVTPIRQVRVSHITE